MKLVSRNDLRDLVLSNQVRARMNLHESPQDPVQKMIYVQKIGDEKPPHANSRELTKVILYGHSELILYDDKGRITDRFDITPEGDCAYTLPANTWHANINKTSVVVFFEVMPGPYPADDVRVMAGSEV